MKRERPRWYPGALFWVMMTVCASVYVWGAVCIIRHHLGGTP